MELIQRIELHELDARFAKDLLARDGGKGPLQHAVVARVAIVARIVDQRPIVSEKCEIDAPGVDADSVECNLAIVSADGERMPDLMKKPERVPIQPGRETHRRVRKTMQLFECEPSVIEGAQDGTAAFGSEVDGEESADQFTTVAEMTRMSASPAESTLAFPMAT